MSDVIDAHQHFWDLQNLHYAWIPKGHEVLDRNYLPENLEPLLRQNGIARTVVVQAHSDVEENRWALRLAARHDFIAGVVGTAPLDDPHIEATLAEFADQERFVGVRFSVEEDATDGKTIRPDLHRGLAALARHGLACDLQFVPATLRHVPVLARAFPELRCVIPHLGNPDIKGGQLVNWRREFLAAARCPNVYAKLSGLITCADVQRWQVADLRPYVATAVEAFGFERLMFGSDWPVCLQAGSYQRVVEAMREALGSISESERAWAWGGTARAFYALR